MEAGAKKVGAGVLALLVSCAGLTGCGQSGSIGLKQSASIVNGTVVENGDVVLKSTVGLLMKFEKGTASCTGTLLSNKVLLTAAHCVAESPQRMAVLFSKTFASVDKDTVRSGVTAIVHPLWGKKDAEGQGDLALVLFNGGLPEGFEPAQLLPQDEDIQVDEDVIVTGYGVSSGVDKTGSGTLRRTTQKILGMLNATEVVTDGHERSICFGDSGGPSYVFRKNQLFIWGVASAVSNDSCSQYAIHTDLATYHDWIKESVAKLTDKAESGGTAPVPTAPAPSTVPSTGK